MIFLFGSCGIAGEFTRFYGSKLCLCAIDLVFYLHDVLFARDDKTVIVGWLLLASSFYPVVQNSLVLVWIFLRSFELTTITHMIMVVVRPIWGLFCVPAFVIDVRKRWLGQLYVFYWSQKLSFLLFDQIEKAIDSLGFSADLWQVVTVRGIVSLHI